MAVQKVGYNLRDLLLLAFSAQIPHFEERYKEVEHWLWYLKTYDWLEVDGKIFYAEEK
jgi:hypothetical protein